MLDLVHFEADAAHKKSRAIFIRNETAPRYCASFTCLTLNCLSLMNLRMDLDPKRHYRSTYELAC